MYDQAAFAWHDEGWQAPPLASAILYEMHVGTFTPGGTLDSAIERLDYLVELGVTHVELMPVAEFAGDRGWGYDGVDLFAVAEHYGGPDGLKRFVDACHARGLAVVLDVVYNHFGPVGNYAGKFGPYLTNAHCTPWGDAVNLEERGSDEVRRFFCDNALMWMRDFHIDGLRLDAVHGFVDRSAVHFLEQLSAEVEVLAATLGRTLVLIAESDLNDPRVVRPREAGGYGMDAQWSDDFHHALFTVLHRRREAGLLLRTSGRSATGEGADAGVCVRRAVLGVSRAAAWQAGGGAVGAPLSRVHPEPRPGGQSRGGRPGGADCGDGRARRWRREWC